MRLRAVRASLWRQVCPIAVVGDRALSDVLYGNLNGAYTIQTVPFAPKADNRIVRVVRRVEDWFVQRLLARNVAPPRHPSEHITSKQED